MPEQLAKIHGLKELDNAMKGLPRKLQKQVIGGATSKGAQVIKRNVQRLARQRAYDTGVLARNVRAKRAKRKGRDDVRYMVGVEHGKTRPVDADGRVKVRAGKTRRATRREKAGEDPYYYHFVELGTARGIQPARYMTDGIRISRAGALRAFIAEGRKRIDRAFKKRRISR